MTKAARKEEGSVLPDERLEMASEEDCERDREEDEGEIVRKATLVSL